MDVRKLAATAGFRRPAVAAADAPQFRCALVAEDGALAAGEHSRHPSSLIAEAAVPDGVNTAMNAVQAASGNPDGDTARENAGDQQLLGSD